MKMILLRNLSAHLRNKTSFMHLFPTGFQALDNYLQKMILLRSSVAQLRKTFASSK